MDGQIIRQSSSYRRGLVLGLTMAEIMLLLVFCLLIAMAAFLRVEHQKVERTESELRSVRRDRDSDRAVVTDVKENLEMLHRLRKAVGSRDPGIVDKYWRELVEARSVVAEITQSGLSSEQARDIVADAIKLKANGIDAEAALRDADIVGSLEKTFPTIRDPSTPLGPIADSIGQAARAPANSGHQWPPIINLSEAGGYHFKTRSAELSDQFRNDLEGPIPNQILDLIKQYDVDVIEVVGHTDERPIGTRDISNLDRELLPVLKHSADISSIVPADNAGLGLARAVAVISVLLQNKALSGYKLLPLSGAQLINNDDTLAMSGTAGDVLERRRIEIRLRKSTPSAPLSKALIPEPSQGPILAPPRLPLDTSGRRN